MDNRFAHLRYVAVDGPIGVGKTTFCRLLADKLEGHAMLEDATGNPFLADFYRNRERFAFQTQTYFLLSRYAQQRELLEYDLFKARIVADYTFEKDALFAEVNLSEAELTIYRQVSALLKKDLPKPDLVVFLTASIDVLLARIKRRNSTEDRSIDPNYLAEIVESYNHHFFHYDETPLLVVKTDQLDFVENSKHLREIFAQIAAMRQGTRYYATGDDLLGRK